MIVLFLDVDGVLNGHEWIHLRRGLRIKQDCVEVLNSILHDSDVKIVIISTWRSKVHRGHVTIDGLEWLLQTHGVEVKIHDVLPPGEVKDRATQIKQYLKEHPEITKHAILDDLPLGLPNHIQTNGAKGLRPHEVTKVRKLLGLST